MTPSTGRTRFKRFLLLAAHRSPTVLRVLSRVRPVERGAFKNSGRWEPEYQQGGWDWLWNAEEAVHHHVIAAYSKALAGRAAILDLGCGEGVLQDALRGVGYARYVGVDLSETAIGRAARSADARTRFMVGNAETFETAERFDLIIFNECLYYLDDPPTLLARLAGLLEADGAFVVSMAMGTLEEGLFMLRLWRGLERDFSVRHEVSLLHEGGPVRIIKVLQPRRPNGQSTTRPPNARISVTDTRQTTTTIDSPQRSHM